MTQLVTRIDDELTEQVDELVTLGFAASRSDAVRRGLHALIDQYRRQLAADAIRASYEERPQTEADVGWADQSTIAMIAQEEW